MNIHIARLLAFGFAAAIVVPAVAFSDPLSISEGIYGTTVQGLNRPSPSPGVPYPFSLDANGNLNVDVQLGGGSTGSSIAIYPSAGAILPVSANSPLPVVFNGSPVPVYANSPLPVVFNGSPVPVYANSPLPVYANSPLPAIVQPSPGSVFNVTGGYYNATLPQYGTNQNAPMSLDVNGRAFITVSTPLPISDQHYNSTIIDHSGTISSANASQVVMPINNQRQGLSCQNQSASAAEWINIEGASATSAPPSIEIVAGASYTTPVNLAPAGQVSIISGTASSPFQCMEY